MNPSSSHISNKISIKSTLNEIKSYFKRPIFKEISNLKSLKIGYQSKLNNFFKNKCLAISKLCISEDGLILLSGGNDGKVRQWNPETLEQTACFEYHNSKILDLEISGSSKYALSASFEFCICLWNLKTKKLMKLFKMHTSRAQIFKFFQNSNYFLYSFDDITLHIWDIAKKMVIHMIKLNFYLQFLRIYKNSHEILFVSQTGIFKNVDFIRSKIIAEADLLPNLKSEEENSDSDFIIHFKKFIGKNVDIKCVSCVELFDEIEIIIVGYSDGLIQIVNSKSLCSKDIIQAHFSKVNSINLCQKYQILASCSSDYSLKLWNLYSLDNIKIFLFKYDMSSSIISNYKLYIGGYNCKIKVIDIRTQNFIKKTKLTKIFTMSFDISVKHQILVYAFKSLYVYCLKSLKNIKSRPFNNIITTLNIINKMICCGMENGKIYLLDIPQLEIKRVYYFETFQIVFISFSKDFKVFIYSTEEMEKNTYIVDSKSLIKSLIDNTCIQLGVFALNSFVFLDDSWILYILKNLEKLIKINAMGPDSTKIYLMKTHQFILLSKYNGSRVIAKNISNLGIEISGRNLKEINSFQTCDLFIGRQSWILSSQAIQNMKSVVVAKDIYDLLRNKFP